MKALIYLTLLLLPAINTFAQDSLEIANGNKPVRDPWPGSFTIDNQTSFTPPKGSFEFNILHRFSPVSQGVTDLYGFYGTSNIYLMLAYGVSSRLLVSFGSEKDNKLQVFAGKYNFVTQTRNGRIPLSLTLYANTSINANKKDTWGDDYKYIDRLSYFAQAIASRKMGKRASAQATVSYSHINKVPGTKVDYYDGSSTTSVYLPTYQNDALAFSASARLSIWHAFGLIAEYNHSLYLESLNSIQSCPKPSLAFGFEKCTPSHVFQLFVSSYRGIVPQYNYIMNQYDMTKSDGIMLGFNIIVKI